MLIRKMKKVHFLPISNLKSLPHILGIDYRHNQIYIGQQVVNQNRILIILRKEDKGTRRNKGTRRIHSELPNKANLYCIPFVMIAG